MMRSPAFQALDTNHDGVISAAELANAAPFYDVDAVVQWFVTAGWRLMRPVLHPAG